LAWAGRVGEYLELCRHEIEDCDPASSMQLGDSRKSFGVRGGSIAVGFVAGGIGGGMLVIGDAASHLAAGSVGNVAFVGIEDNPWRSNG